MGGEHDFDTIYREHADKLFAFGLKICGHVEDAKVRAALDGIRPLCAMLKVFGSYPRWQ